MTEESPRTSGRRRLSVGGAAALATATLVVAVVIAGGDSDDVATTRPSAQTTATTAPDDELTPSASPSPDDVVAGPVPAPEEAALSAPDQAVGQPVVPEPTSRPDGREEATIPLERPVQVRSGVTARISAIDAVEAVANLPGEIGGPGLQVTVEVRNDTSDRLPLDTAVINAYMGPDARPAVPTLEPSSQGFPQSVAPGATAVGQAVFTVPADERDDVRFELDLGAEHVIILFTGSAPGA